MEITGALVLFIFKEICVKYAMYNMFTPATSYTTVDLV